MMQVHIFESCMQRCLSTLFSHLVLLKFVDFQAVLCLYFPLNRVGSPPKQLSQWTSL